MRHPLLAPVAATLALGGAATALAATSHRLSATADLKTTAGSGLRLTQQGAVRTSLGTGRMTLKSVIKQGKVTAWFTVRIDGAVVRGQAAGKVRIGRQLTYDGTARLTSGTGRYRAIRGTGLRFTGEAPLDGRSSRVRIAGRITY